MHCYQTCKLNWATGLKEKIKQCFSVTEIIKNFIKISI